MARRFQLQLWLVLFIGLVLRVALAFTTKGLTYDLHSYALVDHALRTDPTHVYSLVNSPVGFHWPYLPGFFPIVLLTASFASHTGLHLSSLIRLPPSVADLAVAWVAQEYLRARGAGEKTRLLAAGIVAFGPLFIASSAFNGQIDSVGILPAMVAVAWWDRFNPRRRALLGGVLIGLGCAIKTVPLLIVVALLPACRSARERSVLITSALVVPMLAGLPWLASDAHALVAAVKYRSLAGAGGISLIAQPDLAGDWLGVAHHHLSSVSQYLQGNLGTLILLLFVGAAALVVLYFRPHPTRAASFLWLCFFAFGVNFGPRYAIWGIPFFLMCGYLWQSALLQAVLIAPAVFLLTAPVSSNVLVYVYVALMVLAWIAFALTAGTLSRRFTTSAPSSGRDIVASA